MHREIDFAGLRLRDIEAEKIFGSDEFAIEIFR
jgi:hypothetical protein